MTEVQFEVIRVERVVIGDKSRWFSLGVHSSAAAAIYAAWQAACQIGGAQWVMPGAIHTGNGKWADEIAVITENAGYICINEIQGVRE